MARCPFALWKPVGYDGGSYTGGPFRIVIHTTENSSIQGAYDELIKKSYASHFLIDGKQIWQLIDTGVAAKALQHKGPPETNRLSAVQIECVGFAGRPKDPAMLANLAKLCRWIETEHDVPEVWPNGFCKVAINGKDPGHHNRSVEGWMKGGYFGHSNVPNNIHWDPALTIDEIKLITPAAVPPVHWT